MLATPLDSNSWLTERLAKFGESPVAYLLGTPDLAAAKKQFAASVDTAWFGKQVFLFDHSKLNGARLGLIR